MRVPSHTVAHVRQCWSYAFAGHSASPPITPRRSERGARLAVSVLRLSNDPHLGSSLAALARDRLRGASPRALTSVDDLAGEVDIHGGARPGRRRAGHRLYLDPPAPFGAPDRPAEARRASVKPSTGSRPDDPPAPQPLRSRRHLVRPRLDHWPGRLGLFAPAPQPGPGQRPVEADLLQASVNQRRLRLGSLSGSAAVPPTAGAEATGTAGGAMPATEPAGQAAPPVTPAEEPSAGRTTSVDTPTHSEADHPPARPIANRRRRTVRRPARRRSGRAGHDPAAHPGPPGTARPCPAPAAAPPASRPAP